MTRGGGGGGQRWAAVEYPWMWIYAALSQQSWPSWQSRAYPASSIPLPPSGSTSEVPGPSRRRCSVTCFSPFFGRCGGTFEAGGRAWTPRPCLGRWREAGWRAEARAPIRDLRGRSRPRPTMPPPVTSPLRSQRRGSRASRSLGCRRRVSLTSTCTTQVSFSREPTGG